MAFPWARPASSSAGESILSFSEQAECGCELQRRTLWWARFAGECRVQASGGVGCWWGQVGQLSRGLVPQHADDHRCEPRAGQLAGFPAALLLLTARDSCCGLPPCTGCSNPPCSDCFAGNQLYASHRPGCDGNDKGVGCVPPKSALGYKGQHWPTTVIHGTLQQRSCTGGDKKPLLADALGW